MLRRERIVILLTFYNDVREGFKDPPTGGGDGASRFQSTWSGPEYSQLNRLLDEMRLLSVLTYRHLVAYYMGSRYVRRARCPRCGGLYPSSVEARTQQCDGVHHGRRQGKSITMEPYMERVVPAFVVPQMVKLGVDWLEANWLGECDLPKEIRECLHAREIEALKRGRALVLA